MLGEFDAEIENDADDGGGDGGECGAEAGLLAEFFDVRGTEEDKEEAGDET
jgi:hypothetical protein